MVSRLTWKKHARVSFSKTIKIAHKSRGRVHFEVFEKRTSALTKAKVWERYGKVWAIYDPYVGMIWDSIDIMWDWYGV
jgi:hypothetical protein